MNNAEWTIQNGMKFSKLSSWYLGGRNIVCYDSRNLYEEESSVVQKNIIIKWLDMEHTEQILDDSEKQYLSAVIRPFRDKVKYITKGSDEELWDSSDYRLMITFANEYFDMYFPSFSKDTMYKGMKLDHKYSLEELGL